jgi:rod shape-determining protein MreB
VNGGDIAIDLGTASTRVAGRRQGVIFDEPSVAAVDMATGKLVAFGRRALRLRGRSAGHVRIVRPLVHGQLVDLDLADDISKYLLEQLWPRGPRRPAIVACIAGGATGVQRRALADSLRRAGARRVELLDHQTAAAIGARLPIADVAGSMIVDIGSGTTDIAVHALGAAATCVSVPLGGGDLDYSIREHCRQGLDLVISAETAEQVRVSIGSAVGHVEEMKAEVRGRDAWDGSPRTVVISSGELFDVMDSQMREIVFRLVEAIQGAPPDLANDLLHRGVHLAGGVARQTGMAERLAYETGLPVYVVEEPELCTVRGAVRALTPGKSSVPPPVRRRRKPVQVRQRRR